MKIFRNYIKFAFLLSLVVLFFAFGTYKNSKRYITGKDITFLDHENHFISHETVNKLLIQNEKPYTSLTKEILDLKEIEIRLNNNPYISKAQVFITVDGILGAKIKQRKPIARVASQTSFYIDQDGNKMPLSELYSARVPIITGNFESINEMIKPLLVNIREDQFLKHNIIGIHIDQDEEIILYHRIYDFNIVLGKPENLNNKFKNFKAFYQKTIKDSTISAYNLVNLKYDNQVVATKK